MEKRLIIIGSSVAFLLLIPLIAMQFTNEVNWNWFDFLVAGTLLFGTGLICDIVIRKVMKSQYKVAMILSTLVLLFLVWAELAVGIFGTPLAGS